MKDQGNNSSKKAKTKSYHWSDLSVGQRISGIIFWVLVTLVIVTACHGSADRQDTAGKVPSRSYDAAGNPIYVAAAKTIACQEIDDLKVVARAAKEKDDITYAATMLARCEIVEAGERLPREQVSNWIEQTYSQVRHRGKYGVVSSLWMWSDDLK